MSRVDVRTIRRKQILEATKRLVIEKGWTEISVLDICREAGISSGVLTYHFRNKDEIMFTLVEEVLAQIEAYSYQAVPGAYTPQEDINTFLGILASLGEAEPHFASLLIQVVAASLHRPEIAERLHKLFSTIRHHKIEEWKAAGVVNEQGDDGLVLVSMLHSIALGVALAGPFMGIDLPLERVIQETRRVMLACFPSSNPSSQTTSD
jgi:AcrR family transcriptional regulator